MKQRRIPSDGTSSRCRRYASRRRRRARFLTMLPPSRRPTAKPTARGPGSRRQSNTNAGPSTRAPRRKSRSNFVLGAAEPLPAAVPRARAAPGTPLSLSAGRIGAPTLQHLPAAFRRHALAEPMLWRAGDGSVGTSASRLPPSARNATARPTPYGPRTASSAAPRSGRDGRGSPSAPRHGGPPGSGMACRALGLSRAAGRHGPRR